MKCRLLTGPRAGAAELLTARRVTGPRRVPLDASRLGLNPLAGNIRRVGLVVVTPAAGRRLYEKVPGVACLAIDLPVRGVEGHSRHMSMIDPAGQPLSVAAGALSAEPCVGQRVVAAPTGNPTVMGLE